MNKKKFILELPKTEYQLELNFNDNSCSNNMNGTTHIDNSINTEYINCKSNSSFIIGSYERSKQENELHLRFDSAEKSGKIVSIKSKSQYYKSILERKME